MHADRILFTTPYCSDYYDYFRENTSPKVDRLTYPRINSYGLRFIKQNLPCIDIMEYPTWDEYTEMISRGWDIVGFSFFTPDYPKVEEMAAYARQNGVKQIWGGSYGTIIPQSQRLFDRTFIGYSESALASALGLEAAELVHPPIIDAIGATNQVHLARAGILFTSRGCPYKCTFCQTPIFCGGKRELLPMAAIHRVLSYYKSIEVPVVLILDETFGLTSDHSGKVVELLKYYGLPWIPMTRVDVLTGNLDRWMDCGMAGAMLGVENLHQENIQSIQKKTKISTVLDVIDRLLLNGRLAIGFYMIGFENETVSSIIDDINTLSNLGMDLLQVCVLTPFHGTPLWTEIEQKFGAIDDDLSMHTTKNLVWKHPNISKDALPDLLMSIYERLYPYYQLEHSRSKYFGPNYLDSDPILDPTEFSRVTIFDEENVISEPRLSPCRLGIVQSACIWERAKSSLCL